MVVALTLLLYILTAALSVTGLRRHGAVAARIGSALLAATAVGALVLAQSKSVTEWRWRWITDLNLQIHLVLDDFAVAMVCVVAGLGALVLWYSTNYFADHRAYAQCVGLFLWLPAQICSRCSSSGNSRRCSPSC